jgi:hypothetical protein
MFWFLCHKFVCVAVIIGIVSTWVYLFEPYMSPRIDFFHASRIGQLSNILWSSWKVEREEIVWVTGLPLFVYLAKLYRSKKSGLNNKLVTLIEVVPTINRNALTWDREYVYDHFIYLLTSYKGWFFWVKERDKIGNIVYMSKPFKSTFAHCLLSFQRRYTRS